MEQYYAELIGYACDADARTVDEFIAQMADCITLEFCVCGMLVEVEKNCARHFCCFALTVTPLLLTRNAMPQRIQLKRTRGWRLKDASDNPNGVVVVSRPTKWGNPYKVVKEVEWDEEVHWWIEDSEGCGYPDIQYSSEQDAIAVAVDLFRADMLIVLKWEPDNFEPLRGKDLACWCPLDQACHADVLLELCARMEDEDAEKA